MFFSQKNNFEEHIKFTFFHFYKIAHGVLLSMAVKCILDDSAISERWEILKNTDLVTYLRTVVFFLIALVFNQIQVVICLFII